jgi:hypothetical protein
MENIDDIKNIVPLVDYSKSINQQQLVYVRDWSTIAMRVMLLLLGFGIIFGGSLSIIEESNIFGIVGILLGIFMLYDLWQLSRLVKVKGKSIIRNKEDVINALKYFYDGLTFDASQPNVIRDIRLGVFFNTGRIITVILDDDDVYFNITTPGRGNSVIAPFSGTWNYYKCKEIAAHFLELQNNN